MSVFSFAWGYRRIYIFERRLRRAINLNDCPLTKSQHIHNKIITRSTTQYFCGIQSPSDVAFSSLELGCVFIGAPYRYELFCYEISVFYDGSPRYRETYDTKSDSKNEPRQNNSETRILIEKM